MEQQNVQTGPGPLTAPQADTIIENSVPVALSLLPIPLQEWQTGHIQILRDEKISLFSGSSW
jgi:hypothetical protein